MELIKRKISDTGLFAKVVGRIDINTAVNFGQEINDELDDIDNLILDFEGVDYVSSMGLRVLLELQKRMQNQGKMELKNVQPDIMAIFTTTGFDKILTIN